MAKSISRRDFLRTGLASAAVAGAGSLGATKAFGESKAKFNWRMQHMFPAGCLDAQMTQRLCEEIGQASGGRLKITSFAMGTLAPAPEMLDATGKGMLQMGYTIGAYHGGKVPVANLGFAIPYLMRGMLDVYIIGWGVGLEDVLREAYAKHNAYLVSLSMLSAVNIWSKVPIRGTADLKGLKIRAAGLSAEVLSEAGASPVFFPGPEIYQALQSGVVDAAVWGDDNTNVDLGFHEVTKYVVSPLQINIADFYVNMDEWKALPDDLKEIVTLATQSHGIKFAVKSGYKSMQIRKELVDKYGLELITLPEAEVAKMTKCTEAVLDKYALRDPTSAKAIKMLKVNFIALR